MAFVSQSSPDQAQDPNQQGQSPLSQQAPMTSAPNAGAGKSAVTPSNSAPTQPFTNLQSYLSANEPQIKEMGNNISGQLSNQYGQTVNDINQANTSFQGQVNSGYTPNQPDVISAFTANPSAVASNPDQAAAFKGMYGDTYKGPANFETTPDYGKLSGEIQQGQSVANQVSSNGLSSYLTANNPNYTQGMATLDSALLQGNPDVQAQITAAAQPFQNLPGYLTSAVTANDAAVQNAVQQAQAAKAAAQSAGSKVSGDFSNRLNTTYQNDIQKAIDYNNQLNDITGKIGNQNFSALTPDEQKLIGYNPAITDLIAKYPSIFQTQAQNNPINFSNYYTQGDLAKVPQSSDIVSPDDIATYHALQALTGNGPALNFDMPTTSTAASFGTPGQPGVLPQYNNAQALAAIEQAYNPFYQQALGTGALNQDEIGYMNTLNSVAGGAQPGPMPTTPPPAPGTGGDLGAGFHWDVSTGTWQPTIPLQPMNPPPSSGGGLAAR